MYKKKDETEDLNVMVGSGVYQHSIIPIGYEPPQPSAIPRKSILKGEWKYKEDDEFNGINGTPARQEDQYEGAQTRVSVTDGGAPTAGGVPVVPLAESEPDSEPPFEPPQMAVPVMPSMAHSAAKPPGLPPISEVNSPDASEESFDNFGINVDIHY